MRRNRVQRMQEGGMPEYDEYEQTDDLLADDPESDDSEYVDATGGGLDYSAPVDDSEDMTSQVGEILGSKRSAAIQQLQDARMKIMQSFRPQTDRRAMYLAMAQGFLSPTRTGGFGESLGNAAGAMAPFRQQEAQQQQAFDDRMANMDYDLAAAQYKEAMADPKYQWIVGRNGRKQQAVNIDGQLFPIGRELAPTSGGGSFDQKVKSIAALTGQDPKKVAASLYQKMLSDKGQTINVNNTGPAQFEKQDAKNAADRFKTQMEEYDKFHSLNAKLGAMDQAIDETPDAYFGPGGKGLVYAAQALKQLGFDVGEGLDNAELVLALQSSLGPAMRISGSGASSDKDVDLLLKSIPGLSRTKEGNKAIVKYYKKLDAYNRRLMKIAKEAHERGDFWGLDQMSTDEIDKAGRIFTDADVTEIQNLLKNAPTDDVVPPPAPKARAKNTKGSIQMQQNPDGSFTFNPGGGN